MNGEESCSNPRKASTAHNAGPGFGVSISIRRRLFIFLQVNDLYQQGAQVYCTQCLERGVSEPVTPAEPRGPCEGPLDRSIQCSFWFLMLCTVLYCHYYTQIPSWGLIEHLCISVHLSRPTTKNRSSARYLKCCDGWMDRTSCCRMCRALSQFWNDVL